MFAVSTRHTEAGAKRIASERRATPRRDALIAASREWERRQAEAAEARRRAEQRRELAIAAMDRAIPKPRPSTPYDARNLIGRVAAWHGYTVEDVLGPSRARPLIQARFDAVAAVATTYPGMSLPMLGRLFKRDHTTILHALRVRGLR
jgi:chromosomal replication initiation ATPase DnaA